MSPVSRVYSPWLPPARWLAFAVIVFLAVSTAALAQPAAPAAGDRARAEAQLKLTVARLERDKDLTAAKAGFEKAHELDALYPKPLLYLGDIAFKQEDWAAAIKYYDGFSALDPTSDDYQRAQLRLDDARKYQQLDATPEGRQKRQQMVAKAAAEAAAARAQQDVDQAERQLADYDKQITEALKDYLPTSGRVTALQKARDEYYQQASPRLLEVLTARQAELEALSKEMRPTAAPVQAKRAEVDRLRRLCRATLVPPLLAAIRANDGKGTARVALNQLLALDPQNAEGRAAMARLAVGNSLGMALAYIPAGEFDMGSPAAETGRYDNETPHPVKLTKGFYMATTPVTQAQWKALMGTTVVEQRNKMGENWLLAGEGDNYPMYYVSWDEAVSFCEKLSRKDGKHYSLPTEAQWEYACRAGTTGAYGGAGNLDEMGWSADNSGDAHLDSDDIWRTDQANYPKRVLANNCRTHPVAQKKPNAWGLYDMHGNVWQWCSDYYGDYPAGSAEDSTGPANGDDKSSRVLRGGSWYNDPRNCRSAYRRWLAPVNRDLSIGFRVCLDFE